MLNRSLAVYDTGRAGGTGAAEDTTKAVEATVMAMKALVSMIEEGFKRGRGAGQ